MMPRRLAFLASLLFSTVLLPAAEGGFAATLSQQQLADTGLADLTETQRSRLDQLVAADLAWARQNPESPLPGTFSSRRDATEREQAGIVQLSADELAKLDELVATTMSARPKPKERPRLKESDVIYGKRQPEIHGSVSVSYGWASGGRNFRNTSLALGYYDPAHHYSLSIGLSTGSGDFFPGFYPGCYGYGGSYRRPWGLFPDEYGYDDWFAPGYDYDSMPPVSWGRTRHDRRRW